MMKFIEGSKSVEMKNLFTLDKFDRITTYLEKLPCLTKVDSTNKKNLES